MHPFFDAHHLPHLPPHLPPSCPRDPAHLVRPTRAIGAIGAVVPLVLWLTLLLGGPAPARAAPGPEAAALQLRTPQADEVLETGAGLVWARCVEGMRWSGSRCQGRPLLLTRAAALQRASERQRDSGLAWRLPTGGLLVFSAISDGTQS